MKNSVLNTKVVDTTKQPLFLGEGLSLQRYDKCKYEVFLDLFKRQMEFFWRPEEINLTKDRADFKQLSDYEKFIFTSNLKFQTLLDSVIARGIPCVSQYVSSPELEACMNMWAAFEGIHSYSYTYLIQNVFAEPSKIMDSILEDKEILKRAESVRQAYDALNQQFANEQDLRKQIYLTLISINILEGLRFYVSFACALAFEQNKKMTGNAKVIELIRRDENCVTPDTEVLTPNGWVRFDNLKPNTKVAQYNQDKTIEFVVPNAIIEKEIDEQVIHLKTKTGHIDSIVTKDHRVIYLNLDGQIKESTANEFNPNNLKKIPVCGYAKGNLDELSWHEKFLVALQADGTIPKNRYNGSISGCVPVTFDLKKIAKKNRLKEILDNCKYEYTESEPDNRGHNQYYIKVPIENPIHKTFENWVNFEEKSSTWCANFIDEVSKWDGSIRKDTGKIHYSSSYKSNTDIVQAAACLAGYKTYQFIQVDNRKDTYSDMYRLSINNEKTTISGQSLNKSYIDYKGKVYCVNVPSGMFLARRKNNVFITGNCHLAITQNIIRILNNNPEEGFQQTIKESKDQAVSMFLDAVNEEKEWASYLFKDGGLIGLNEKILHQYIEWLADNRMSILELPKQFGSKNPINWLESSAKNKQPAPQEQESTNYKVNASIDDVDKMDFSFMD